MRTLIFEKKEWDKLQELCEKGYPKEVCGLLLGKPNNSVGGKPIDGPAHSNHKIVRAEKLENILNGNHSNRLQELMRVGAITIDPQRVIQGGYFEFVIDPLEHYQKIFQAERAGLDQIGIFHSHPDHPAQPSAVDAAQPFLAGWSNLIVSIRQGKFKEAQSWFRESENSAFQMENILVE